MDKIKDRKLDIEYAKEVFGVFDKKVIIITDELELEEGTTVVLTNSNCEFSFDNVRGVFADNLSYYFVVDLELVEADYSEYNPSKSNNGGAYAYGKFKVLKIWEKSY